MWLQVSTCLLAVTQLLAPTLAAVCPKSCVCTTTRDGLHRATCSSLTELYKFTLRQKHHNINVLDLSHNNITKLSHELDRLTEVVTLDLSTNGFQTLNKFLHNSRKLVHLNLANNRIQKLSFLFLPSSISSLDLKNNLLSDVPSDLSHLVGLEHLEMEGNPLDCSCENIMARDRLLVGNVFIDDVKCFSPTKLHGQSWLELKTKEICKSPKTDFNYLDMMMGDQPIDPAQIAHDTNSLKSASSIVNSDLEEGNVIRGPDVVAEDDDSRQFLKAVGHSTSPSPLNDFEGSGEAESTTISELSIEPRIQNKLHANLMEAEGVIPVENNLTTEDPLEGSGEGSGFLPIVDYVNENEAETTTESFIPLIFGPIERIFEDDLNKSTTEFPMPEPPSVYQGGRNWNSENSPSVTTEKILTSSTTRDTTVSEQIRVTQASEVQAVPAEGEPTHKTGTYVCIAIIVVLLVGLIGFAIVKGQMRKRRDRRLLRQQKRDVEKASKEMVDMNKSLLGKPAPLEESVEKKVNGKYELVPTHEVHQKKENREVGNGNGVNHHEPNGLRTDSPRDTNQNKSSSKDNNLKDGEKVPQQETSFESGPASPDSRNNSLSSEDIFVPINDEDLPKINGTRDSDISHPLINGDQNTDSDFLSPSREYIPVYSPDMGRVRIKMTETPKPKTPVLVTRSRSNAGDIIITPADDSPRKSTT